MKGLRLVIAAAAVCGITAVAPSPSFAKGCIKGAIVGGVAGHMVGHGKLGAVAGCAVGHHQAKKASAAQKNSNAANNAH